MKLLKKCLQVFGIALLPFTLFAILGLFSERHSLFFLMVILTIALPSTFLMRYHFTRWLIAALMTAIVLAASPIDFTIQSGELGLHLLPVSHGLAHQPGTARYGCIIGPNPPLKAIVLSFGGQRS